jgi:hypothetical protein
MWSNVERFVSSRYGVLKQRTKTFFLHTVLTLPPAFRTLKRPNFVPPVIGGAIFRFGRLIPLVVQGTMGRRRFGLG